MDLHHAAERIVERMRSETADVVLDEPSHIYYRRGRRLPSPTQVLHAAGQLQHEHCTPEALDRGTRVHRAADALARVPTAANTVAFRGAHSIRESERGYLDAACRWRETGIEPVASELRVYYRDPWGQEWAGTLDLLAIDRSHNRLVVADYKCSATGRVQPGYRIQVAAYTAAVLRAAMLEQIPVSVAGLIVPLRPNSRYGAVIEVDAKDTESWCLAWMLAQRAWQLERYQMDLGLGVAS